jgi:hypothetical protein
MKVRTLELLSSSLDDEFAWRIKELHEIHADVKAARFASKNGRLRAGIALLYAHWEGFVGTATHTYLQYVAGRGARLEQLSAGLLALAIRGRLKAFASNNDVEQHISIVTLFRSGLAEPAKLPTAEALSAGGNLNSDRVKQIVLTLGLDYAPYELKENLLDAQLLRLRNSIAHGKGLCPTEAEFDGLFIEVLDLLRCFKTQIENAAALKLYEVKS